MSSFIHSSKHFNSIERSITDLLAWDTDFYLSYSMKNIYPTIDRTNRHYYQGVDALELKVKEIIDELRTISVLCVSLQYAHHYTGVLDNQIKTKTDNLLKDRKPSKQLTKPELLKALKSVRYQIEPEHLTEIRELTAEEGNAMLFLNEMINSLAMDIATSTGEYEDAEWSL